MKNKVKNKMKSLFVLGIMGMGCLTAMKAEAALPPVYQSIREYKALIDSPELSEQLGSGEGIVDIQRTSNGFLVKSFNKTLNVDIVHEPQANPGPAKFHLIFHPLEN